MGKRERYEPGTFCWIDLGTDDAVAAKAFYTGLFGWDAEDMPMGDDTVYTMFSVGGRHVCALYGRDAAQGPPAWLSYISVADADSAAARAGDAGALSVGDPFDVFGSGRMAVVQDPTGAHVALWQPGTHIGAGVVNGPGLWCLNQLNTSGPDRAAAFYTEVFEWRFQSVGTDEQPYWGIFNGDDLNGGMMPLPPGAGAPAHWLPYFGVEDADATAERIAELGGRVIVPPVSIPPAGRIAVALDPQKAAFALFAGRFDP
jgi:predicted enzyme related to lactoylglutathione lyase